MKDDILVEQTLAGDKQAFNSLITDYYADIYGMILSWVNNPEDAKDLTQDVFISAYLDLPSLSDHERFYSWLRQIARHKCQNWKRKQIDFIPLDNNLISREPSADEVLILHEILAKVMEAIDSLPESEKRLLKEHYLDDVSYDELESRHGVSAKVLVMRLVRARRKIRDQLEKMLSVFVAFLHNHTESILIGGTEIMKLSIKTKLIAGGIAVILLLVGAGVLVDRHYVQNKSEQKALHTSQEDYSKSSAKSVSNGEKSYKKGVIESVKKEITHEKIQADEYKAETSAMNEAKNDKFVRDTDSSKVLGRSADESKNLIPEIKQKAELYAELSLILPEYLQLESLLIDMSAGKIDRDSKADERFAILEGKIINLFGPILHSPAVEVDDAGNKFIKNTAPALIQISEYLGKELPFDGSPDYFAANDYRGGTGGWDDQ